MLALATLQLLLLTTITSAATECEFLVGTDFQVRPSASLPPSLPPGLTPRRWHQVPAGQPGAGTELKVVEAKTKEECCDACGEEPGCEAAAWNGNDENHFNHCYMKGPGAKKQCAL